MSIFLKLTDLSFIMILGIFLIPCESEPPDSYKNNSYKKVRNRLEPFGIFWNLSESFGIFRNLSDAFEIS